MAASKLDYYVCTRCSCGRTHRAPGTPEEMSLSSAMSRCNLADKRLCQRVKDSGTRRPATRPHQRDGAGTQNCGRSASHTQINTNTSNTQTVLATRRPHPQGATRDHLLSRQQGAIRDHLLIESGCTRLNFPHLSSGRYTCACPREVPVHPELVSKVLNVFPRSSKAGRPRLQWKPASVTTAPPPTWPPDSRKQIT